MTIENLSQFPGTRSICLSLSHLGWDILVVVGNGCSLATTGKVLVDPVVFCQQSVALASPSVLDFAAWTFALAPTQTLGGAAPSLNWSPIGSSFCGDYIVFAARRCLLFLWGKRKLKHFCSVVFISNQLSFRDVFPVESHSRINLFGPLRSLSPNWLRIHVTSWSV